MFEKILVPVDGSGNELESHEEAKNWPEAFVGNGCCQYHSTPITMLASLVVPLDQATISHGNEELIKDRQQRP